MPDNIIGNGLLRNGGGAVSMGTLGDAMFNTSTANLEGLYLMGDDQETATTTGFTDSSGNDRPAIIQVGGAVYDYQQTDAGGNILNHASFTPTTPNFSIAANMPGFSLIGDPFSVVSFFSSSGASNTSTPAFLNSGTATFVQFADLLYRNDSTIRVRISSDTSGVQNLDAIATPGRFNSNFHMLALTHDGTNSPTSMRYYYDGVLLDSTGGATTPGNYTVNQLAAFGSGLSQGPLAYWSTELTASEIATIFAASGL